MRYFTDGAGHVARVDTDAKLGEPEFIQAQAAVFSVEIEDWKPSQSIIDKILFSGDWYPCDEDQATVFTHAAVKRLHQIA